MRQPCRNRPGNKENQSLRTGLEGRMGERERGGLQGERAWKAFSTEWQRIEEKFPEYMRKKEVMGKSKHYSGQD